MLTNRKLQSLKPRKAVYRVADARGLCIEVRPTGALYWRYRYRCAGKAKMLSLGTYPAVSLAEARLKRDKAHKQLAQGKDPATVRKAAEAERAKAARDSFEAVAREWYAMQREAWAENYRDKVLARLENDLLPYLGSRPVAEIKAPELLQVLRRVESRGAVETAYRELRIAGQVFRYAVATGRAERDPSGDLKGALKPHTSKHMASVTDPVQVGEVLRMIWPYDSPIVGAALKLGAYTFVRPGELRMAEWADIDLDAAEWRFTTSKTKTEHVVPLSRQALAILRDLHPLTGAGRYVFPSARGSNRPMSNMAVNAALRRVGIDKDTFTGHGWRAAARTMLDEVLGFRPDWIEHQLAHAVRDPNGRAYNRTAFLPERHKMMQAWADYLDSLRTGGNVVALRDKRGA